LEIDKTKEAERGDLAARSEYLSASAVVNHKGQICVYNSSILCQEGYCTSCWIYLGDVSEEGFRF